MDRETRTLLLGVVGCAVMFCLVLALAYSSRPAWELDTNALSGFLSLRWGPLREIAAKAVGLGDPPAVILAGMALTLVALVRGRPRAALAVLALVGVTSVSSQVLKAVLARPRVDASSGFALIHDAAFPSGHATAAMALAICCVMVAPRRVRPLAALAGAALALGVGFSLIVVGSHLPSDVAGGFLLAAGWGLGTVLALRLISERWPETRQERQMRHGVRDVADAAVSAGLVVLTAAGALLLGVVALLVAVKGIDEVAFLARAHTAVLVVGPALVALALALLGAAWAGLRRFA